MVQAPDNRARLRGRLRSATPSGVDAPAGWCALDVEVTATEDVPDLPNLLGPLSGSSTVVLVPEDDLPGDGLVVGCELEVLARRAGPRRVLADPATLTVGPPAGDTPAPGTG